ncbi:hypothetical protein [Pseudoneobacillus rhizosphaerae]|uniref:Group-specific protein n=1 Tax=Pseudoneobacillus rhizosphaerae TaxID=2880968 RepID=A0A9C7GAN6_9BACI|nr:hypothetical protein [Pseudoneobacillus rhizosphaerae]CAG9608725.1 hypothetical protein NEOCIP111885_02442 [Pseudoneobacillus rhizosphaerae]
MKKKIMIILFSIVFLYSPSNNAQGIKNVELFDIQKDTVTQVVPSNTFFQKAAKDYLNGINGIFVKVKPIPNQGYMIKIPLEPSVQINNEWITELVDEVIIIFTKDETPYLMVFDDENNPHFFHFKGNTNKLVKTFILTH